MKKLLNIRIIYMLLVLPLAAGAQQIEIPLIGNNSGLQYISLGVNGEKTLFIFDTGANGLTINETVYNNLLMKGLVSTADLTGTGQATLANGSVINVQTMTIRSLMVGNQELKNVPAMITPSSAPSLVGQSVLQLLGNVQADFGRKMLIITPGGPGVSPGIPVPGTSGGKGIPLPGNSTLSDIYTIKLIPCSQQDVNDVSLMRNALQSDPNFSHVKVEVENNIPPANAVQRLTSGAVTVRHFSGAMASVVQLQDFLQPFSGLMANSTGYPSGMLEEDMLPSYNNNPINNYIEIWFRSN